MKMWILEKKYLEKKKSDLFSLFGESEMSIPNQLCFEKAVCFIWFVEEYIQPQLHWVS